MPHLDYCEFYRGIIEVIFCPPRLCEIVWPAMFGESDVSYNHKITKDVSH